MVRSLQLIDPKISNKGTLAEWYTSTKDRLIWAKRIESLDPTTDSEILEHPIKQLQHPPVPESSPSFPNKQSHLPQTPGSTHSYLDGGQTFFFLPEFSSSPVEPSAQNDA
eukprot:scaffold38938_cov59-Attheya_sp.AAC.3